ncbi:MAG: hypothetical protein ACREIR_13260 [Geminicoccaceae bacterium]
MDESDTQRGAPEAVERMPADRAIWASWYDLDEGPKATFLGWLHGECLPFLRERRDCLWVAHYQSSAVGAAMRHVRDAILARPAEDVGSGTQFLMLLGARAPDSFLGPAFEVDFGGGPGFRDMLGQRRGVRTCLFLEETRVDGPAPRAPDHGLTPAPAIQMGSLCMRGVEEELDLARWYRQLRRPAMTRTPGCIAARKLLSVAGWAKHAILYEFASLEDRMRHFEEAQEAKALDPTHWTSRIARTTVHAPGSPTVGQRIWPPAP